MKTRKTLLAGGFLAAIVLFCIAGTKVSRMIETTYFGPDSWVYVVTNSSGIGASRKTRGSNFVNTIQSYANNAANTLGTNLTTTNATMFGVFYDKSLQTLRFMGLAQGSNMVLYRDGSNIVINGQPGSGGAGGTNNTDQFSITGTTNSIKAGALVTNMSSLNLTNRGVLTNQGAAGIAGQLNTHTIVNDGTLISWNGNVLFTNVSGEKFTNELDSTFRGNIYFSDINKFINVFDNGRLALNNGGALLLNNDASTYGGASSKVSFDTNSYIVSVNGAGLITDVESNRYRFSQDASGATTNQVLRRKDLASIWTNINALHITNRGNLTQNGWAQINGYQTNSGLFYANSNFNGTYTPPDSQSLVDLLDNGPQNNIHIRLQVGSYVVSPSKVAVVGSGAINILNRTNLIIEGAGPGKTIIDGTSSHGENFYFSNCHNVILRNLESRGRVTTNFVTMGTAADAWANIALVDCEYVTLENIYVNGAHNQGIMDMAAIHTPPWLRPSTNGIVVRNCEIYNVGSAWTNTAAPNSLRVPSHDGTAIVPTGWLVEGNYIHDVVGGIEPFIAGTVDSIGKVMKNCVIRNNTIVNYLAAGITTAGSTNFNGLQIIGNTLFNPIGTNYTRRGTNIFWDCEGILCNSGNGFFILNNYVHGARSYGIDLRSSATISGGQIRGNIVVETTNEVTIAAGMIVGSTSGTGGQVRNLNISGNLIDRSRTFGLLADDLVDSIIDGNIIKDVTVNEGGHGLRVRNATTYSSNVLVRANQIETAGLMTYGLLVDPLSKKIVLEENQVGAGNTGTISALGPSVNVVQPRGFTVPTLVGAGYTNVYGESIAAIPNASTRGVRLQTVLPGLTVTVLDIGKTASGTNITVTPATGTIFGGTIITNDGGAASFVSDGTNWYAIRSITDVTGGSGSSFNGITTGLTNNGIFSNSSTVLIKGPTIIDNQLSFLGGSVDGTLIVNANVTLTGKTPNRVLTTDGTSVISTTPMQMATAFSGLSAGQGLIYDTVTGTWTNGTVGGSGEINAGVNITGRGDVAYLYHGKTGVNLRFASLTNLPGITIVTNATDATIYIGATNLNTAQITNDAVTFAKMQNITTDRLIGRDTAGTGDPEELTVGGGVEFTGSGGIQRSALSGDVTVSAGALTTTIANDAVTYAKMQNVSAASRLLGRGSAGGAGDPEEISLQDLTMSGTTLKASTNLTLELAGTLYAGDIWLTNTFNRLVVDLGNNTNIVLAWSSTNAYMASPSNTFTITMSGAPSVPWERVVTLYLVNTNSSAGYFPTNDLDGLAPVMLSSPSTNTYSFIWNGTDKFYIASGQGLTTGRGVTVLATNGTVHSLSVTSATPNRVAVFAATTSQLTNSAGVDLTELEYLDGVTSAIQTQLNGKQNGQTNANQFGATTTLTMKDVPLITNIYQHGTLIVSNSGATGFGAVRFASTNNTGYTEIAHTNAVTGTNRIVLSLGTATPAAAQVLKIHSATLLSGAVNNIVLTNDTDSVGSGEQTATNANQFGAAGALITIKDTAAITNVQHYGRLDLTNGPGAVGTLRFLPTNGQAFTEITTTNAGAGTNQLSLSLGATTLAAGLPLKIHSATASGGTMVAVITNDLVQNYETIYVDAGMMLSNATFAGSTEAGATFNSAGLIGGTNRYQDSYIFSDAITNSVQFKFVLPEDWDTNTTCKVKFWFFTTNNVATRTNVFDISASAVKSTVVASNDWGTAQGITNVMSSSGGQVLISSATPALTIGNTPTGPTMTYWRIRRQTGDIRDNDVSQTHLLGCWIQYKKVSTQQAAW